MAKNTSPEVEKNETESNDGVSPEVKAQEEKNKQLRRELAELRADSTRATTEARDNVKLTRLSNEERQLQSEIDYQKRLKAARTGNPVEEDKKPEETPDPVQPPATDPVQNADSTDTKNNQDGKKASANGKGN